MLHQKRLNPVVVTLLADPIGNGQGGLGHLVVATSLAVSSVRFASSIRAIAAVSGGPTCTPLAGRWPQHPLGKTIESLGDQPGLAGQTGVEVALRFEEHLEDAQMLHHRIQLP